jgi:hypothetical protein
MRKCALLVSTAIVAAAANHAAAAIAYTEPGFVYTQDFNSFPLKHPNGTTISQASGANLQVLTPTNNATGLYSEGWKDDTTSDSDHISIPGWYLYGEKDNLPASDPANTEGGYNGHQRLRYNTGSATAASFYAYASVNDSEKALGTLSGTAIDNGGRSYIGAAFVNDTGTTMTEFTIKYRGEQWRASNAVGVDFLDFQWSTSKTAETWGESNGYSGIAHSFDAPQNPTVNTTLDGNADGNFAVVTHTIPATGEFAWAPGETLFIRWRENNISGSDDGLAIDDVEFTAVPEPTGLAVLGLMGAGLVARRRRAR